MHATTAPAMGGGFVASATSRQRRRDPVAETVTASPNRAIVALATVVPVPTVVVVPWTGLRRRMPLIRATP